MRIISNRSVLFATVLLLSSCAYVTESSHQDIQFVTPGAEGAKCYAYVNKLKYQVYPPQTINMKKSHKDMKVECQAPGNRVSQITVPAKFESKAIWGSPAGVAWDYASQSLHSYPDIIAIDFSQEAVVPNTAPQHNNEDIIQPEAHNLEEFVPTVPRMNKDKNVIQQPIQRVGEGEILVEELGVDEVEADMMQQKGNLEAVMNNLVGKSSVEKAVEHTQEAVSEPVDLFPGQ